MISTLYYLRSQDLNKMNTGDETTLTMFFDQTNYKFKLRLLGREFLQLNLGLLYKKAGFLKKMKVLQFGLLMMKTKYLYVSKPH
jgi:hypothetical protein